jgi:iron complex transport system permease protein
VEAKNGYTMKKPLVIVAFLIAVTVYIGLSIGPVSITWWKPLSTMEWTILIDIRLLRLLTAFLVGGSLAVSGAVYQGILQNPLADPYVLGVSSGAALGACISLSLGLTLLSGLWGLAALTFIGALASTGLLMAIVSRLSFPNVVHYVLTGIMVNAFFSSTTLLFIFLLGNKIQGVMMWLMGDLSHSTWTLIGSGTVLVMIITGWIWRYADQLNGLALGDDFALSMGISVKKTRWIMIVLTSLLTGFAVAAAGVVGFIGLIVPHSLRLMIKEDFKQLIPLSFLAGGWFLMAADSVSRLILTYAELPVGVITSLCGAPFFLLLLYRMKPHNSMRQNQ